MENVPPFAVGHGVSSHPGEQEQEDPESLTDEQLAWKLMQEEENALQERMMAMAGLGALNMVICGTKVVVVRWLRPVCSTRDLERWP